MNIIVILSSILGICLVVIIFNTIELNALKDKCKREHEMLNSRIEMLKTDCESLNEAIKIEIKTRELRDDVLDMQLDSLRQERIDGH